MMFHFPPVVIYHGIHRFLKAKSAELQLLKEKLQKIYIQTKHTAKDQGHSQQILELKTNMLSFPCL